jgi:O-antigen/teichoic acid export membrane protein
LTQERDTISRNAGFAFAIKMVGAVCTAALTIVLVRVLGPSEYGVFALAMSIGGLVFLPADLGIAQSAARFVAESISDRRAIAALISDAVRVKLLAAGLVSLALVALAGPIADGYGEPDLVWPLRILALSLFAESFLLLYNALFQALGKISIYLRVVTLESTSEASLSIAIVLLGGGAAGAMAGRAAAYAFAAGYGLVLVGRTIGRRVSIGRGAGGGHVRRIFGYGSALLVVDGAITLFSRLDALLIGAIVSVTAVGRFEAPLQLAGFLGYIGQSIGAGVAPRMARSEHERPDLPALERGLAVVILLQGVFVAPLLVWAEPIQSLVLGPGYEDSADVLRALAPFAFLVGVSPMVSLSVNYLGQARRRIPIAVGAVVINVAIDLALLSQIGIVAAAIGTDVAYSFYVVAHLWLLRRMVGLSMRPIVAGFARATVAAAAMSAVLLALGTGDVALPVLLLGAPVGVATYVVALLLVRAITPAELRGAAGRVRALVRPGVS